MGGRPCTQGTQDPGNIIEGGQIECKSWSGWMGGGTVKC